MTEQPKDGGAAFPTGLTPGHYSQEGMSLRDWFAGQALTGLTASYNGKAFDPTGMARIAYEYADAMILAREATQ